MPRNGLDTFWRFGPRRGRGPCRYMGSNAHGVRLNACCDLSPVPVWLAPFTCPRLRFVLWVRKRCRNGAIGESSTFRLFVSMMWSAVALDAPAARLRGRMFPCASIPKNRRATT